MDKSVLFKSWYSGSGPYKSLSPEKTQAVEATHNFSSIINVALRSFYHMDFQSSKRLFLVVKSACPDYSVNKLLAGFYSSLSFAGSAVSPDYLFPSKKDEEVNDHFSDALKKFDLLSLRLGNSLVLKRAAENFLDLYSFSDLNFDVSYVKQVYNRLSDDLNIQKLESITDFYNVVLLRKRVQHKKSYLQTGFEHVEHGFVKGKKLAGKFVDSVGGVIQGTASDLEKQVDIATSSLMPKSQTR